MVSLGAEGAAVGACQSGAARRRPPPLATDDDDAGAVGGGGAVGGAAGGAGCGRGNGGERLLGEERRGTFWSDPRSAEERRGTHRSPPRSKDAQERRGTIKSPPRNKGRRNAAVVRTLQSLPRNRNAGAQERLQSPHMSSYGLAPELLESDEYRKLYEKYGHRLRVPQPPPPASPRARWARMPLALASPHGHDDDESPAFARHDGEAASAATPAAAVAGLAAGGDESPLASPGALRRSTLEVLQVAHARYSAASLACGALGAACGGRRLGSVGTGLVPGGLPQLQRLSREAVAPSGGTGKLSSFVSAEAAGFGAAADAAESPERSLMPRKEALRRRQQEILAKRTDVVFYRSHMRKHFQKILAAVELTYNDTQGQRQVAAWNLAKPLTQSELQQFSSVGARQP